MISSSAERLHRYLCTTHWDSRALVGPDPGIRLNARVGRFIKSYTPFVPWSDSMVYLQAQGYWILDNWMMWRAAGDAAYRQVAVAASDTVLDLQRPDGHWPYPNPEWRGRVATVEGCFATLGLLESYAETGEGRYLHAAERWYRFMEDSIGYRRQDDPSMIAVNYFQHRTGRGGGVPNNSTLVLWMLARLWELSGDDRYLARAPGLRSWLSHVQRGDGELPYAAGGATSDGRLHFLCQQYNAFEFMDLVHYRRITGDDSVTPMMEQLAGFLASGVVDGVRAAFDCNDHRTRVLYYDLAVAQALKQATELRMGDHDAVVSSMYRQVVGRQRPDGSFAYHSSRNYGFLRDRRSYPRYLSMMLHHLLLASAQGVDV